MTRILIQYAAKDPESVKFLEQTVEKIYPNDSTYGCKWLITATNGFGGIVQGYGVASVHFKGGDIENNANWTVITARIIETE